MVTHPVLLGNGSILGTNGYDEKSRLLLMMPPDLSVVVPDRPSLEDVRLPPCKFSPTRFEDAYRRIARTPSRVVRRFRW